MDRSDGMVTIYLAALLGVRRAWLETVLGHQLLIVVRNLPHRRTDWVYRVSYALRTEPAIFRHTLATDQHFPAFEFSNEKWGILSFRFVKPLGRILRWFALIRIQAKGFAHGFPRPR